MYEKVRESATYAAVKALSIVQALRAEVENLKVEAMAGEEKARKLVQAVTVVAFLELALYYGRRHGNHTGSDVRQIEIEAIFTVASPSLFKDLDQPLPERVDMQHSHNTSK